MEKTQNQHKKNSSPKSVFSLYQKYVVSMLATLQFTVILNFMILSPLGTILINNLGITLKQFGLLVSCYAFSAALSGILFSAYADRFDRKKLLLIFYTGFLTGTLLCALASNYHFLLGARIITGLFGGIIGSISLSIVADVFPMQSRGQAMGIIQSAFSASQMMGIPIGLFLANFFNWHAVFLMIALIGSLIGICIWFFLKPLTAHLEKVSKKSPLQSILSITTNPRYFTGLTATMLVASGGFILQPFASTFSVNNMGISLNNLPLVYMIGGLTAMLAGPYLGKLSDSIGKFSMFAITSTLCCIWMLWYTALGITPLWTAIFAQCLFALFISGRMSATMALISAVPAAHERGAYMALSTSMQQLAGGLAASAAGLIVLQNPSGKIENYSHLGWFVVGIMVLAMIQMFFINQIISKPQENLKNECLSEL